MANMQKIQYVNVSYVTIKWQPSLYWRQARAQVY